MAEPAEVPGAPTGLTTVVEVQIRLYAEHLEVYYKGHLVERMERVRGEREARVDYRHIIGSLVCKPGAFARYRFREQMFPSMTFRLAYDALKRWRGERADVEYVRILHLAATTMESTVDSALALLLEAGDPFDYAAVKDLANPTPPLAPGAEPARAAGPEGLRQLAGGRCRRGDTKHPHFGLQRDRQTAVRPVPAPRERPQDPIVLIHSTNPDSLGYDAHAKMNQGGSTR